jgi:hypothetical protein
MPSGDSGAHRRLFHESPPPSKKPKAETADFHG